MSTKTTFKRIALVAVAALGLGVLSVAPSSAAPGTISLTVVQNGTASLTPATGSGETGTAAILNVSSLLSQGTTDSLSVEFIATGTNPTDSAVRPLITFLDTTTASSGVVTVVGATTTLTKYTAADSFTVASAAAGYKLTAADGSPAVVTGQFGITLESATASVRKAGTYTYLVIAKGYSGGAINNALTTTQSVTITIAAAADASKTPSAVKSFANLYSAGKTAGTAKSTSDDVLSVVATASTTAAGYVFVGNRNALDGNATAEDSLTATVTGAGVVCASTGLGTAPSVGACGKSVKVAATGDYEFVIRPDGTAGTSSVAVTSGVLGVTYTKSLTFYASSPKTWTTSVLTPRLVVGTNDSAVVVTAVDANGTNWTGTAYIYAATAADALIGGSATTGVPCVASSDKTKQYCPITTKAAGTANFKISDKSDPTIATAVNSDAVSVTATLATAATVKLAFDKATYSPGEKAVVTVTPVDSAGNAIAAVSSVALLSSSTAAITSNTAVTIAGTTTATVLADGTAISTSAYAGTDKTAGSYSIVVYMPISSGTVTISAKGGSALPLAGQVAITASASVVNASVDAATDAANEATDAANAATDAALAAADAADAATAAAQDASDAVAALSATVATLVASLKAQITSLTNLVIKIQKKVKA